jgi:hypothetical protein
MRRTLSLLLALAAVTFGGAACGGRAVHVVEVHHVPPGRTGSAAKRPGRVDPPASFVLDQGTASFGGSNLVGPVQSASRRLSTVVPRERDLNVKAIHSPDGSAAVQLREHDTAQQRWGRLMIPAERRIIAAFARDPSFGQWLIIVDDVKVRGGTDPIPRTGYRWKRADVEAYARCGIPTEVIDLCTQAFYATPEMWVDFSGSKPLGT